MKTFKRLLILAVCIILTASATTLMAQEKGYEYVVTLKSGVTLRGEFIKKDSNGFITLRNAEKGIININPSEVSFMQREELPANAPFALQRTTSDADFGFQFAPGLMIGLNDETAGGFQLHGVAFMHVNQGIAIGAGIGIERTNEATWLPAFGQLRVDLDGRNEVAFLAIDFGYTALIHDDYYHKQGGLMAGLELGFKFPTSNGKTFFMSTTYRYQHAIAEQMVYALERPVSYENDIYPPIYPIFEQNMNYHYIVLSAGIIF